MDKLEVTVKVDGENLGTLKYYKGEFDRAIKDLTEFIEEKQAEEIAAKPYNAHHF